MRKYVVHLLNQPSSPYPEAAHHFYDGLLFFYPKKRNFG